MPRPYTATSATGIMLAGLGSVDEGELSTPLPVPRGGDGEELPIVIPIEDLPPGWVAPGAVPVYVDAWDTTDDPALYTIQGGDTLVGLAATYLGDGARWKEIWNYQTADTRSRNSPDRITTTRVLQMPPEARDNFLNWIDRGKPGNKKPGEVKPTVVDKVARSIPGGRTTLYVVGGLGVLGALYTLSS